MKRLSNILTILWLGLLSSQLAYAADDCPKDSLVGRSQNGTCTYREVFNVTNGDTVRNEKWVMNEDSVLVGVDKSIAVYRNDTVVETASWVWSDVKKDWIGSEKTTFAYENGKQTEEAKFKWENNDWTNVSKTTNQYKNGQVVLTITYVGDGKKWIPQTKLEKDYQGGKKILERKWSAYDASTDTWTGESWEAWKYESTTYPSKESSYEKYNWANNNWAGEDKYDMEYTTSGKTLLKRTYINYDPVSQTWQKKKETHYGYDKWGNTTLIETYLWKETYWKGDAKKGYEYNESQVKLGESTYGWKDSEPRGWVGVDSTRWANDAAGNQILDEKYIWKNNGWYGDKKEEYVFNDFTPPVKIRTTTYAWQEGTPGSWIYATRDTISYDPAKKQNVLYEEHYIWQKDGSLPVGGYWKGNGEKKVSEYTNNKVTLQEVYTWQDEEPRGWIYKSKNKYQYSGNNKILVEEYKRLDNGQFVGTKCEKYGYNASGKTIVDTICAWDAEHGVWKDSLRGVYDYDKAKNKILDEQYKWENSEWVGTKRLVLEWDAKKNQILDEQYTWENGDWVGTTKLKSAYDDAKNQILDEQYTWENGDWVGTTKKEYKFNAQGQQIMYAFYNKWENGKWIGSQKDEKEQDDEGREILAASYRWENDNWVGKNKTTTTYYKDLLIATKASYTWKNEQWTGKDSTLYTYNSSDMQDTIVTMTYQSSAWVNSTKVEKAYTVAGKDSAKYDYSWKNDAWQPTTKWEAHFSDGKMDVDSTMLYKDGSWIYQKKNTNTFEGKNLVLIMTENWDKNGNPTSGSKTVNTYSADGLTRSVTSEKNGENWVEKTKKDNTYTSGKLTETIEQENTDAGWQFTHYVKNEYAGSRQTLSIDQKYKDGKVASGERIVFEYNDPETIKTLSAWDSTIGEDGDWVEQSRVGTYKKDGVETVITYQYEDTKWVALSKVETKTIGKNKEIAQYKWDDKDWVGISKKGTYVDEYEDETIAEWSWEQNGSEWYWECVKKEGQTLYSNGKTKSKTTYKIVNNTFVYNTRVEYEYGSGPSDVTTANYTYNGTTWTGTKSGVTYVNGEKASETTYTYLGDFQWKYNGKTEYAYGNGNDKSTAKYVWRDSLWAGISKDSLSFYENGDSLGVYKYCWKGNDWADSLKTEYTYFTSGEVEKYIQAKWNVEKWDTLKTSTWLELTLGAEGRTILDAKHVWNESKRKWDYSYKRSYQYDAAGNKIYEEAYTGASLKGDHKYIWTYNAKNKITLEEKYSYNKNLGGWYGTAKEETGYYKDTINNMSALYRWESSKKAFKGVKKDSTLYDDNGVRIGTCAFDGEWEKKGSVWYWKWILVSKTISIKDNKNRPVEQSTYSYDDESGDWYYIKGTKNLYDDTHTDAIETWEYGAYDGDSVLTSHKKTTYDDEGGKLRSELVASWETTGEVISYEQKTYFYACDPKFQITVKADPEDAATVTGGGEFILNGQAVLTATPNGNCYTFDHWEDEDGNTDTNNPKKVIVTEDKTYTAIFSPVQHTIRASVKLDSDGTAAGGSVRVTLKPKK